MAKTEKSVGTKISRTSESGRFVVAKQVTKAGRFSDAVLKEAVHKVKAARKGAARA